MSAPKTLSSDTMIADRDIVRSDWEGSPRFYSVRITVRDPSINDVPRVMVHVELEGDPSAYFDCFCDADNPDDINESVFSCIHEIESLKIDEWAGEQDRLQREMEADYWRSKL